MLSQLAISKFFGAPKIPSKIVFFDGGTQWGHFEEPHLELSLPSIGIGSW